MKNHVRAFWTSDRSLSVLLWALVLMIFVVVPTVVMLGAPEWERVIAAVFFTAVIASGVMAVWSPGEVRRFAAVGFAVPMVLLWVEVAYHPPFVSLVTGGIRILLVGLFTTVLLSRVLAPGPVTRARIKGALAVYLLIGVVFEEAFRLLCMAFPGAVNVSASHAGSVKFTAELIYFSFSTLTTAGYGDVVPVHPIARSLANAEAITGQMYIVLLIGRLLTLHLAQAEPGGPVEVTEGIEGEGDLRTTQPRRPAAQG